MLKKFIKGLAHSVGVSIIRSDDPTDLIAKRDSGDPFAEQKRLMGDGPLMIFDVGAYIGEVSRIYVDLFPIAQVHSFEPFSNSFEQLRSNLIDHPRVHVHKMGLSDRSGLQLFYSNTFAPTNSLLEPDPAADETWGKDVVRAKAVVECEFVTLDEFVEKNNITRIDILKLDVQGTETKILDGARKALKNGIIAVIYSEIITMPTYKGQQKLWEILRAFDHYDMDLHNIYNLHFSNGRIKQFDAIFVRRSSLQNRRS